MKGRLFFGHALWIGLLSGLASGLLGLGGAIVLVPLMTHVLGLTQHHAHGTSLAVVLFTAAAAFAGYARTGHVDVLYTLPLVLGSVLGSPLGARWASALSAAVLRRAFGIFLMFVGARLLLPLHEGAGVFPDAGVAAFATRVLLGGVVGVLSGFFGVGGGIVLVPALVLLGGVPQHVAQGISLLFIVPTAASGVWAHRRLGNVQGAIVLPLAAWSMIGGFAASQVAAVIPGPVLRVLFGLFVVGMGVHMTLSRPRHGLSEAKRSGPAEAEPAAKT